jgi:DNA-binding HxlR family transcriptional regulator
MFDDYTHRFENAGCADPELRRLYGAFMLLQEKWTLFIVHHLLGGPRGFNELGRTALGVNTTTLSQRLDLLERAGLLTRTVHSTMPPRTSYELTEAGRGLAPVIEAIGAWGERFAGSAACAGEQLPCPLSGTADGERADAAAPAGSGPSVPARGSEQGGSGPNR